ncbi:PAS domain S-box protein [Salidesulfovibrio onnuriiensis]|uniref:PAS domain S-box protein n=1 Tax=Salidesulfovibrio onnuriiensis TaxID=2583823 RepID=UPI00165070B1|nr:PAS domain S-box protein [Salidesulfovibrio onnuriiensis]
MMRTLGIVWGLVLPLSPLASLAGTSAPAPPPDGVIMLGVARQPGLAEAFADPLIFSTTLSVLAALAALLAMAVLRRQQAEKQLCAESGKYVSLFENASEGIVLVDRNGIITDANPKARSIMGLELQQLRGMTGTTLLHPDDAPLSREQQRRLDAGMTARMQRRIRTRQGSYIPVDMSIKRISENVTQIMFRDLSELELSRRKLAEANLELAGMYEQMSAANQQMMAANKELQFEMEARTRAEDELREREKLLRTVLRSAPLGIGLVEDRIVGWTNETLQAMLGYSAEELDGMPSEKFYENKAEYERVGRVKHAEVLEKGYGSIETRFVTRDGRVLEVLLASGCIERGDLSKGLVFTVQDLTELRRAQQESRDLRETLFRESAVVQLLLRQDNGDIAEANRAASDYFGTDHGSLQGAPLETVFSAPPGQVYHSLRAAALDGHPARLEVRRGTGRSIAELHVSPLTIDGKLLFYAILHDVAERMQAEEALLEAKHLAESASRMKNEFLANISHEVRTPLNGMLGMLQLLDDTPLSPEQGEFVRAAFQSGQGLQSILNDILDFSLIEAGKIPISRGPLTLTRLVDNIALVFRRQCMDKNIGLTMRIDDDIPDQLDGDEARLRQILFNLVGNAVKFTENGGVAIEVSRLSPDRHGNMRLMFMVRDTGIGISEERLPYIFDPFTQGDGSLTRRFEGTGLGLSIVKRLCELMNGSVAVDSETDRGTDICVVLPFKVPDTPQPTAPEELPLLKAAIPERRVLIAEDNPVNSIATRRFVEKLGFEAVCAKDGAEAVKALRKQSFDCILMDIQMPVMSGIEATRLIRSDQSGAFNPEIPIVALTAHAMQGDRERFLEEGMNAYLPKPVEFPDLARLLSRFL